MKKRCHTGSSLAGTLTITWGVKMGKKGALLRQQKKDNTRYTFTGTELEEHDRQVIRGWQETAYPMLKKRAEEEARKHTQAVIAAIDARWDERREQFQSGGWDTYFTNAISFFMSISCRVLIEQFGWKPPNAGQHGRHTKIMKYAEALAETVTYIATDSELDIVQYAEETKRLYGLEFRPGGGGAGGWRN